MPLVKPLQSSPKSQSAVLVASRNEQANAEFPALFSGPVRLICSMFHHSHSQEIRCLLAARQASAPRCLVSLPPLSCLLAFLFHCPANPPHQTGNRLRCHFRPRMPTPWAGMDVSSVPVHHVRQANCGARASTILPRVLQAWG